MLSQDDSDSEQSPRAACSSSFRTRNRNVWKFPETKPLSDLQYASGTRSRRIRVGTQQAEESPCAARRVCPAELPPPAAAAVGRRTGPPSPIAFPPLTLPLWSTAAPARTAGRLEVSAVTQLHGPAPP